MVPIKVTFYCNLGFTNHCCALRPHICLGNAVQPVLPVPRMRSIAPCDTTLTSSNACRSQPTYEGGRVEQKSTTNASSTRFLESFPVEQENLQTIEPPQTHNAGSGQSTWAVPRGVPPSLPNTCDLAAIYYLHPRPRNKPSSAVTAPEAGA